MDFKAAIQAEIEAKKRQLAKVSSSSSSSSSVKVSDLEKQRQDEYIEKQKLLEEQRQVKEIAKIKSEDSKQQEQDEVEDSKEDCESIDLGLIKEIEKKLKSRGEPIKLFAETDRQRMKRLKLLECREEERSGGQRNDFNELFEKQESAESADSGSGSGSVAKRLKKDDGIDESINSITEIDQINRELLLKDRKKARELIEIFFKVLLREWQTDLDTRSDEIKKSTTGRMTSATFEQAKEHLKPFFRMLKKDELPSDILSHITDITGYLQQKEYVRANDTYLRLSIGNAPWPIGVTMVGIHERSAHEKINSGSVAHALNDEVTRKWIQSIKRLMTFCQKVYPPTDASKAMG